MAKLVILFVCVAALQLANALQCYTCQNCEGENALGTSEKCGKALDNMESVCLTHIYKAKGDQKVMSTRKCVQYAKGGSYKCDDTLGEEVKCATCTDSNCNNSAAGINLSMVAISGILLALIAPKFLV